MNSSVQPSVPQALQREKIARIIRFAIGLDLHLEPTRSRHRLWKLFENFGDEESARVYLEKVYWPDGPVCPRCVSRDYVGSGVNPYRCNACDRQFTVRTDTIFAGSHIPLHLWLWTIVIYAQARRKVSSTKLAVLLGISQPAAWSLIRKLRSVWRELWDHVLKLLECLDFIELPITPTWRFFSGRARLFTKHAKGDLELSGDAYSLAPDEMLIPPELFRASEKKAADDAAWKSIEKLRKAENWARKLERSGKRMKRFVEWLARRKEEDAAHGQDHLNWIPFKWMTKRDCPLCRFGEREWRHWEGIAVHFDLALWEEFWDWIEDLGRQAKLVKEAEEELRPQYGPIAPMDWEALEDPERERVNHRFDRLPMEGVEL
jgi:transposase-like protein